MTPVTHNFVQLALPDCVRKSHGRARVVLWLLIANAVLTTLRILALFDDSPGALLPKAQSWLGIATILAWLAWVHLAYANLLLLGLRKRNYNGALLCWFVPGLNLFRPYQIVRELWLRSDRVNVMANIDPLRTPTEIVLWWLAFMVSVWIRPLAARGLSGLFSETRFRPS